jgi:hypothetical protein
VYEKTYLIALELCTDQLSSEGGLDTELMVKAVDPALWATTDEYFSRT